MLIVLISLGDVDTRSLDASVDWDGDDDDDADDDDDELDLISITGTIDDFLHHIHVNKNICTIYAGAYEYMELYFAIHKWTHSFFFIYYYILRVFLVLQFDGNKSTITNKKKRRSNSSTNAKIQCSLWTSMNTRQTNTHTHTNLESFEIFILFGSGGLLKLELLLRFWPGAARATCENKGAILMSSSLLAAAERRDKFLGSLMSTSPAALAHSSKPLIHFIYYIKFAHFIQQ